jgi:predicted nucleotidyltransferase
VLLPESPSVSRPAFLHVRLNHEFFLLIVPKMGIIVPDMGTINRRHTGLGEALFSKTQRQVLGLLFGNPDRSYYANEIVRLAGVGIGTVQRELEKLSGAGLLSVKKVGNQKHYQADRQSPIFEELRGIVLKTFGVGDVLRLAMAELADKVKVAFVYGSVAKGTDKASSDIDVMIISEELSYDMVFSALSPVESKLGRSVNPTLYKPPEFRDKLTADSGFMNRVMEQPKIFLIGTENDLPKP